jgi:hypothetical protein
MRRGSSSPAISVTTRETPRKHVSGLRALQLIAHEDSRNVLKRAALGADGARLSDTPHEATGAGHGHPRCSMSKRIHVVEDQEDLRAILRDFLSAASVSPPPAEEPDAKQKRRHSVSFATRKATPSTRPT